MLWDPPFIGSCKGQGQVRSGYKCRGRVRGRQSVMDAKLSFRLSNCSSVTAFTYHPLRREIVTGHEDGSMKCWLIDSGKLVLSLNRHKGYVTELLFWAGGRSLFSGSIDGTIVQWTPGFVVNKEIEIRRAVYSLHWYCHCDVLLVGLSDTIGIIHLSGNITSLGHPYLLNTVHKIEQGHSDIVKCITSYSNKVYTAGYDGRLCIFEPDYRRGNDGTDKGKVSLKLVFVQSNAHSSGITCLEFGSDSAGSTWIFTGSFDRQVKIWSGDCKLVNTLQFMHTVTGVAYVKETGVLWVAAGTNTASHFEPKSGDNISSYLDHTTHSLSLPGKHRTGLHSSLQYLTYFPESKDIIGIRDSKDVLISRYNKGSSTCIQSYPHTMRCLAYTKTRPILIFTGTSGGEMIKWERLQLNPFMYSQDSLPYMDNLKQFLGTELGGANLAYFIYGSQNPDRELGEEDTEKAISEIMKIENREFVKVMFVEELDMLVASAWDGKIFVWGFDETAAKVLSDIGMNESGKDDTSAEDLITYNRVAGLIIQHIMNGHSGPVQALALVEGSRRMKHTYLLSGGWDLSVCIWDMKHGNLCARKKNCIPDEDYSDDLLITDIAYSQAEDVFAFSSSNHKIYLMNMDKSFKILRTLDGHAAEVTQICWNPCNHTWVSGSENGQICIWSADGSEQIKTLSTHGPVSVLSIDTLHNLMIVCVRETIKVYNDQLDLVQVGQGHTEAINDLLIVPELNQYVTVGDDDTLRIWNAYRPKNTTVT